MCMPVSTNVVRCPDLSSATRAHNCPASPQSTVALSTTLPVSKACKVEAACKFLSHKSIQSSTQNRKDHATGERLTGDHVNIRDRCSGAKL